MSLFPIETRELRSFRIKYRIEELRFLIENKNTALSFCITTSLHPIQRGNLRVELNKLNLSVISISKNIINFLFQSTNWKNISNLLEGELFLVINKTNNLLLTKEYIEALTNLNNFSVRLFLYNNQIYRKESLKLLLASPNSESNNVKPAIYNFLIKIILKLMLALTLRKTNLNLSI